MLILQKKKKSDDWTSDDIEIEIRRLEVEILDYKRYVQNGIKIYVNIYLLKFFKRKILKFAGS